MATLKKCLHRERNGSHVLVWETGRAAEATDAGIQSDATDAAEADGPNHALSRTGR